ncbi:MAG: protein kinase domain-containing protein, partial [Burkholderiales bacterium]
MGNIAEIEAIGRFKVVRMLGSGAQGAVYLADDPHLERPVAIKTLHRASDPSNGSHVQLLLDEARTVSKLQHPNIVTLYDAGELDGVPYLVFEYVEGKTLRELMREQCPLPVARAIEVTRDILDGIGYAHLKSVVHRDLKPSNILIEAHGKARVTDFGIAKYLSASGHGDDALLGTPLYMAPEYITQRASDPQSDLFSVGMMLYQMLTGSPAATGESVDEILRSIVQTPFAAPSERNATVDEKLDSTVLKALAKDPAQRYRDAREMSLALQDCLPDGQREPPSAESKQATLDFLLRRMRYKSDFPALTKTITTMNKLVASDNEGATNLSNLILKDLSLTNKILRTVNTPHYGQFTGGIGTISKAVVILGFDAIRNVAVSLMLFEHLQNKGQAARLKEEVIAAYFSGVLARQISARIGIKNAEEATVCAMFHNLGRMLALYYFHEDAQEVEMLVQQKSITEREASTLVLGLSYEELGIGVARSWNFPDKLQASMRELPADGVPKLHTEQDRLRLTSALSDALCRSAATTSEERKQQLQGLAKRFGASVGFSEQQLETFIEISLEDLKKESFVLTPSVKQSEFYQKLTQPPPAQSAQKPATGSVDDDAFAATILGEQVGIAVGTGDTDDSGTVTTAIEAEAMLTAGIQDITASLVGEFNLNDLLRMVLE